MAVDPRISMLLDIYGPLLTQKERDALDLYYNEDLSLREIADNEAAERLAQSEAGETGGEAGETCCLSGKTRRLTITRQGVRDAIKRAETKLLDWEERLGLAEKADRLSELGDMLEGQAKKLEAFSAKHGKLRELEEIAGNIRSVTAELHEQY